MPTPADAALADLGRAFQLDAELRDRLDGSPELAVILEPDGTVPTAVAPAALSTRVKVELAQWKRVAADHGIVAERRARGVGHAASCSAELVRSLHRRRDEPEADRREASHAAARR